MDIDERKIRKYMARLARARMSILYSNGFYGLLLMHIRFALYENLGTAATDGERIYFDPAYMDQISDRELICILEHEILHICLKHVFRADKRDNLLYNIAADIVVNSCIFYSHNNDISSITIACDGVMIHQTPEGKEGYLYTVEEVYEILRKNAGKTEGMKPVDDHSRWGSLENADVLAEEWKTRITEAYEASKRGHGRIPGKLERMIERLEKPRVDWRRVLHVYAQNEPDDYTFNPPDGRYQDTPFLFPSFSHYEEKIRNILFMIDTSASISDSELIRAYSEVKGAVDQFRNRLEGWLGFFDSIVYPHQSFQSTEDILKIKPIGGGGTNFRNIFRYVKENMEGMNNACIIILTDGEADFPRESEALGIPVIWAMNNDRITPPWGKTVLIDQ